MICRLTRLGWRGGGIGLGMSEAMHLALLIRLDLLPIRCVLPHALPAEPSWVGL